MVNSDIFEEEDFDFGISAPLVTIAKDEPEGYDDLEDDDVDLYPVKKPLFGAPQVASHDSHATATIINLRASIDAKDLEIAELKEQVKKGNAEIERWKSAFLSRKDFLPPETTPDPASVLEAFDRMAARESHIKDQLLGARRRESSLIMILGGREDEITALKAENCQLRENLRPLNIQTKRLMLDPSIHAEFTRLKTELEISEKKVKELQDDLAAVQFTPHSKNGKMLMAKCRTLQEENEEIGREASEGKVHELENKFALQKQLNVELKRGYQELQELVNDINEEAEKLQETVYKLQRQLQLREQELQELNRQKVTTMDSRQPFQGRDVSVEKERESRRREGKRSRHERSRGRDDEAEDKSNRDREVDLPPP